MNADMQRKVAALLDLRRHISIVHHLPGRIRLRLGPALWSRIAQVGRGRLQALAAELEAEGIRGVRVNAAVASVVVEYDSAQVPPENWETLVQGNALEAGDMLRPWLMRYGHLLRDNP